MNKKIIILGVGVALIVGGIFGFYKYTSIESPVSDTQNIKNNNPLTEVEINNNGNGGLIICADKCGDGVCQKELEPKCDNLNCICKEDSKECPEDCQ